MMNFVALFLVVTSLVSAGMWSPSPPDHQHQNQNQKKGDHHREVIVKNGHRVVVVEYDEQGHPNTKVVISPGQDHATRRDKSMSNNDVSPPSMVRKEASSVLPNFREGHSPKELICDAMGKCKHKIARAIETKKEILKGTAHGAKEAAHKVGEAVENVYEGAAEAVENTYEGAKGTAHKVGEAVENVYEGAKGKAHKVGKVVEDKAHEVDQTAKDTVAKAKGTAKTAMDMGKTMREDIERNVSKTLRKEREELVEKAKEAKETAEHAADKVKEGAEELKSGTQKKWHQLGSKGRQFWKGALRAVGLNDVLDPLMSVAHLFGFATAYGMCMWMTFVSSYVLSGNLPAQQFGMVQSKIYRVYFRAMAFSVGMALLGHLWRHRNKVLTGKAVYMLQNYNLLGAFLMILVNLFYLEPRSTKVMFERVKLEKEEGRGRERGHIAARSSAEDGQPSTTEAEPSTTSPSDVQERREQEAVREAVRSDIGRHDEMRVRLKKLNTYSSFLNIMSLMALSSHLVYLAQRLHSSCC